MGIYNPNGQTENLPTVKYSKAGQFLSGKYAGYDRIVMDIFYLGTESGNRYILATKDYTTYIPELKESWWLSANDSFNKNKVKNAETDLGSNHNESITLDVSTSLYRDVYVALQQKDIDKLKLLKEYGSIKIYEKTIPYQELDSQPTDRYKSEIYVKDETNLLQQYSLTTAETVQKYNNDFKQFAIDNQKNKELQEKKDKIYEVEKAKIAGCKDNNTANYENCYTQLDRVLDQIVGQSNNTVPPTMPSFGLSKGQIKTNLALANRYETFQPSGCGAVYGNVNLLKPEAIPMESLGKTTEGVEIFKPKSAAEWIKIQYNIKFKPYPNDEDAAKFLKDYEGLFKTKVPTLEEYTAKNPVLIAKDIFGRYLILGEYDYLMAGGCGKPVIYLYPTEATKINVKFNSPMQLDVDIPKYSESKGWNVIAKPNGQLQDLQTNLTDCKQLETTNEKTKFGQEYALQACQKNNYPYIYWAGNTSQSYPKINSGFVVGKENLEASLHAKLIYIGLNQKETQDMLDYWLPQMLSKNKDFYRFSLLQTKKLDQLLPMTVSPKPESAIRVFLDWQELDTPIQITEQKLIQESRNGYTMIEWGGLKR